MCVWRAINLIKNILHLVSLQRQKLLVEVLMLALFKIGYALLSSVSFVVLSKNYFLGVYDLRLVLA